MKWRKECSQFTALTALTLALVVIWFEAEGWPHRLHGAVCALVGG